MRLVDSIDAVKLFVKHLTNEGKYKSFDEKITEASRRLGISRIWLSQNLKFEREAPEEDMRLVDSIDAVKKYIKHLYSTKQMYSSNDKLISEGVRRLGVSYRWLSENLKFEREAPEELKKAVPGTPTNRDLSKMIGECARRKYPSRTVL